MNALVVTGEGILRTEETVITHVAGAQLNVPVVRVSIDTFWLYSRIELHARTIVQKMVTEAIDAERARLIQAAARHGSTVADALIAIIEDRATDAVERLTDSAAEAA